MSESIQSSSHSNTLLPRNKMRHRALLAGVSLLMLSTASPVMAQTWDGSESTDWLNPLNWNTNVLPIETQNVTIDTVTPNTTVINNRLVASPGRGESAVLIVGFDNEGDLRIQNGGLVRSIVGRVGQRAGSTGRVVITGTNNAIVPNPSEWQFRTSANITRSLLYVGDSGKGYLTVSDGGKVTNVQYSVIGSTSTGEGEATVTGAGSIWETINYMAVGQSGKGTLRVEDGGSVTNTTGIIGWNRNDAENTFGNGTVVVTGDGSLWENKGNLFVGFNGMGDLSVLDGAAVISLAGAVGFNSGSTGTVLVSGAGSNWTMTSTLNVGYYGEGLLRIENG